MLNWTSNGEEGFEGRLGEALAPLIDGEAGLAAPFVDNARFSGTGIRGLDSIEDDGEVTLGD